MACLAPSLDALELRFRQGWDSQLTYEEALEQGLAADLHPAWGRPETLAQMGAIELESGKTREARDLIERALLDAPGYVFALQLQNALSLH